MKKVLVIIIVIILIVFLSVFRKSGVDTIKNEKKYSREIINYLDFVYYSNVKEEIIIDDNLLRYKKIITFKDNNREDIHLQRSYNYSINGNELVTDNGKFFLQGNYICFDEFCSEYLSLDNYKEDNYIDNINVNDYIIHVNSLDEINNKDKYFVIISKTGCIHCDSLLQTVKEAVKEYDVLFYIIDLAKIDFNIKNSIINTYDVAGTPVVLLFDNKNLINRKNGELSYSALVNLLFSAKIKSR